MSKVFAPTLTHDERISLLRVEADYIEETDYERDLTDDEILETREKFLETIFKVDRLDDSFADQKAAYKAERKPLEIEMSTLKDQLKTKKLNVSGTLYHIANHTEGMMETYDDKGELIGSRRLRPSEKQLRISSFNKASNE